MAGLFSRFANAAHRTPWILVGILSLGVVLAGGLTLWVLTNQSPTRGTAINPAKIPDLLFHPTPTPFLPEIQPSLQPENDRVGAKVDPYLPTSEVTPARIPFWQEFDFSTGAPQIEIHFLDQTGNFSDGKPVLLRFTPATNCPFGSGHGCISQHAQGRYLLLTLHSGVAGEAQQLRHALEGTGINTAGLKTSEIQANLENISGSIASLHQGSQNLDYLSVKAVLRIPPGQIHEYYSLPFVDALESTVQNDLNFQNLLNGGEPIIIIETCGWPVPGEPSAEGVYQGTGSVYLVAIGSDG